MFWSCPPPPPLAPQHTPRTFQHGYFLEQHIDRLDIHVDVSNVNQINQVSIITYLSSGSFSKFSLNTLSSRDDQKTASINFGLFLSTWSEIFTELLLLLTFCLNNLNVGGEHKLKNTAQHDIEFTGLKACSQSTSHINLKAIITGSTKGTYTR